MTEIVDLARARRMASDDSRDWTAEDALEDTLDSIRRGEKTATKLLIVGMDPGPDGDDYAPWFNVVDMRSSEVVALCAVIQNTLMNIMRTGEP